MDTTYTHRPRGAARLGIAVLGGHAERAEWAGRDDQSRFLLLATGLAVLAAWVGLSVALAVSMATGQPMTAPHTLAFAGLMAAMYWIIDLSLVQGRWWSLGRKLARERGFGPVPTRGAAVVEAVAGLPYGAIRIALTLVMALFAGTAVSLWWWQADILDRIGDDLRAANAPLQARIEAALDHDLTAITTELGQIDRRIADRANRQDLAAARTGAAEDERHLMLQGRVDDLGTRLAQLADAIACQTRTVEAEELGLTRCDGSQVAVAGKGADYAAALDDLTRLRAEETRLQAAQAEVLATLAAPAEPPVPAADPEAARRDLLRAERAAMLANRTEVLRQRMQADPAWVAPADGLLIRQKALWAMIADESMVAGQVAATKTLFVLIELALSWLAFGRGTASLYAVAQVVEFETRTAGTVADGKVAQAATLIRELQAEVTVLEERLRLARTDRALRDELRRIDLTGAMLDRWGQDIAVNQADPPAPRFNA